MRILRKAIHLCLTLALTFAPSGCVSVMIAGAGGGVGYTITNIAYKTVSYPIREVETAVRAALKSMDMRETLRESTDKGFRIIAETVELKIYIDLDRITNNVTKISVDARKNFILKDKSTATEIIEQTEKILTHAEGSSGRQA